MKRVLAAAAAAAIIELTAACVPQQPEKPVVIRPGPCAILATRIFETNRVPCVPVPPQRLDVVLAISNQFDPIESFAGGVRCGAWGGAVMWQPVNGVQVQVCRTVDPELYGVW